MGGNNNKNLKPFSKDDKRASEAGMKSKRPPFDQRMKDWLDTDIKDLGIDLGKDIPQGTIDDILRISLVKHGVSGSVQAIKEIYNRAHGQPKQTLDLNGVEGVAGLTRDEVKDLLKKEKK